MQITSSVKNHIDVWIQFKRTVILFKNCYSCKPYLSGYKKYPYPRTRIVSHDPMCVLCILI